MQQALLGRGSNRKTAAGGLKEVVLERCACAPQNMEEGGGSQDGNTVSRKGGGRFAPPQSASVRGPLNGESTAREVEEGSAACSGDVQRRNKSYLHVGSYSFNEGLGAIRMVTEAATDPGVDGGGTEESVRPDSGVSALSSGGYGRSHELEMAAGGLILPAIACGNSQKRTLDAGEEEAEWSGQRITRQLRACVEAGNFAANAWVAEAQHAAVQATKHAQQMAMASAAVSAMASMVEAGCAQRIGDRSRLHVLQVKQAVAAMAAGSDAATAEAASTGAAVGQRTVELAQVVSKALSVIATDTESMAREIKDAVAIATSGVKRQKAAAVQPDAAAGASAGGSDDWEPDWLSAAAAELKATAGSMAPTTQGLVPRESQQMEAAVQRMFSACRLQQAWRRRNMRRVAYAAGVAAESHLALEQRKRDARARLDAREAEEAARRRSLRSNKAGRRQRHKAAVCIQAVWRGFQGRDAAHQQRGLSGQAALCIQAVQMRLATAQRRSSAAVSVQARWRSLYVRRSHMLWRPTAEEATQLLSTTEDAVKPLHSGGRQRRAARLAHQRTTMQQQRASYDWAAVQRARAEMTAMMGEGWEERAQANLERSRLRYADGLSRLASELAPPRRKRLGYATWS